MAQRSFVLLPVVFAAALASAQVPAGSGGLGPLGVKSVGVGSTAGSEPDFKAPFVGSALTCTTTYRIAVPRPLLEKAKVRARLATLLRESLQDDADGIVNIEREKEIKKLANKVKNDHDD